MKLSLVLALLLALLQPGIAPASMTAGSSTDHAEAVDCPHASESAAEAGCEHDDCQCEHACSSAVARQGHAPGVVVAPRSVQASAGAPALLTGFPQTPFRPPIR